MHTLYTKFYSSISKA